MESPDQTLPIVYMYQRLLDEDSVAGIFAPSLWMAYPTCMPSIRYLTMGMASTIYNYEAGRD